MKKIRNKRIIAILLDHFIIVGFIVSLETNDKIMLKTSIGPILITFMLFFKDFIFWNASLGKIITGLRIVDEEGKRPCFKVLIKRAFIMPTLGFAKFHIAFFFTEYIDFLDWERDFLHTQVVLKKDMK